MAGLTDAERKELVGEILERTKNDHLEGCMALIEAMAFFLAGLGTLPLPQFVNFLKGCAANLPDDADGQLVCSVFRRAIADLEYGIERAQPKAPESEPAWLRGVVQGGKA